MVPADIQIFTHTPTFLMVTKWLTHGVRNMQTRVGKAGCTKEVKHFVVDASGAGV